MLGDRLYYHDAYSTQFTAQIVEKTEFDGQPAVVLNATLFYPTSGGQPHDAGAIGGRHVVNVVVREQDNAVLHVLDDQLEETVVSAEIDWPRRFDHMQQHTGQHILSQAFIQLADASTIGFHLSDATVTIDLDTDRVSSDCLDAVEQLANQIVWENRPIRAVILPKQEALQLPLRKVPDVAGVTLRIVEIADFDWNACGGTHVKQTGEVGQIKIIKVETQRGQLRVTFCCGQRALRDYREKNAVLNQLSAELTTSYTELPASIQKMRGELKQALRTVKKQQSALLQIEAAQILTDAETIAGQKIVTQVFSRRDINEVRILANTIGRNPQTIVLFAIKGNSTTFVFASSKNNSTKMNDLLQTALATVGGGKGGGSATYAQGESQESNSAEIHAALAAAQAQIQL